MNKINKASKYLEKNVPQFFIPATYKSQYKIPKPDARTDEHTSDVFKSGIKQESEAIKNEVSGNSKNSEQYATGGHRILTTDDKQANIISKSNMLFPSPGGLLDLSLYGYEPTERGTNKKQTELPQNGPLTPVAPREEVAAALIDIPESENTSLDKEKKRRKFRRPRRNSKVDRLIRILEDKRVDDAEGDQKELEDLKLPRLRKVLNIIFITLGVCFLLAVIIVILYTTFATDTEALNEACMNRGKDPEQCSRNKSIIADTAPTINIETGEDDSRLPEIAPEFGLEPMERIPSTDDNSDGNKQTLLPDNLYSNDLLGTTQLPILPRLLQNSDLDERVPAGYHLPPPWYSSKDFRRTRETRKSVPIETSSM